MALAAAGLLVFVASGVARAAATRAPVCPGSGNAQIEFSSAVAGNRFLATDGGEIVVAGIWTPPGSDSYTTTRILTSALTAKRLTLVPGDVGGTDRYGRRVAYVFADGNSVQVQLLREGVALAAPDLASAACAVRLPAPTSSKI